MSKIKIFLTDSQPGLCSKNYLKIWVNFSLNVLIKKVLIHKKNRVYNILRELVRTE